METPKNHYSEGYSRGYRAVEIAAIVGFFVLQARILADLAGFYQASWWTLPFSALAGLVAADFVSGLVHWAGDTWGTAEWPVIGRTLIRPFREHHVDQRALTRHDFVELNGSNCLVSIPVLAAADLLLFLNGGSFWLCLGVSFLAWMTLWVFCTNMFHQWAHRDASANRAFTRWLQRRGLILSPGMHAIHHREPHLKYYCITTGWLNEPLERIQFYRRAERLVTWLTGASPRA